MHLPRARARFVREIEVSSRLQYAGIVPIYAVGEAEGIPHFAMELVRGCTLGDAVDSVRARAPDSLRDVDLERSPRATWNARRCASPRARPGVAG